MKDAAQDYVFQIWIQFAQDERQWELKLMQIQTQYETQYLMVENEWKWIQMVQNHYETLYFMTEDEWKWIQMRIGLRQQKNQEAHRWFRDIKYPTI